MVEIAQRLGSLAATANATKLWLVRHAERLKTFGLAAAVVLFVTGLALAVRSAPELVEEMELGPFLLLLLTVPAVIALNTAEFRLMARYAGTPVRWRPALEVTIYTSAANLLPVPGGIFTRLVAMRTYGSSLKIGSLLILLFAGIWGGLAFLYSGAWLLALAHYAIGAGFLAVGTVFLVPSIFHLMRLQMQWSLLLALVAVRLLAIVIDAARMVLAISALGVVLGFSQASIFAVSGFIATMVWILPAGLGLRETIVALLSPLVGLDPAIGFLAAATIRVASMIGLLTAAGALYWSALRQSGKDKR